MNDVIDLIMDHRSVRRYQDKEISQEIKRQIISGGQMAASSSFFQAYSIIEVEDEELKKLLFEISGNQKWILNAPWVLLICADLYRSSHFLHGIDQDVLGYTESLIVSVADAALASQNIAISAESLGLGIAFVGGIRNDTDRIIAAFDMPKLVFPLYVMCLGYPDERNEIKPRFKTEIIMHRDRYDTTKYQKMIEDYNRTMADYYQERSPGSEYNDWSLNCSKSLMAKPRKNVGPSIRSQGFLNMKD